MQRGIEFKTLDVSADDLFPVYIQHISCRRQINDFLSGEPGVEHQKIGVGLNGVRIFTVNMNAGFPGKSGQEFVKASVPEKNERAAPVCLDPRPIVPSSYVPNTVTSFPDCMLNMGEMRLLKPPIQLLSLN